LKQLYPAPPLLCGILGAFQYSTHCFPSR